MNPLTTDGGERRMMMKVSIQVGKITAECSSQEGNEEDLDMVADLIRGALLAVGYPPEVINRIIERCES